MFASSVPGTILSDTLSKYRKTAITAVVGVCASIYLIQQEPPENSIELIRNPSQEMLLKEGVFGWHTWSKEPSEFFWHFTEAETVYILEGEVYLTPEGSTEPIVARQGDFVKFAQGLRCHWRVTKPFKKLVSLERDVIGKWVWKLTFGLQTIPRFFGQIF